MTYKNPAQKRPLNLLRVRIVALIRSDEQDWVRIEIEMKKLLVLVLISRLVLRLLEAHTDWYQDF